MIKLKSVIYLISMMTLAGCSGQKQASVAVEEQSGQWILGPFVRPEGVNPVISPQPTTFQCPMRKQPVRWEESDTFNPANNEPVAISTRRHQRTGINHI